VLNFFVRLFGCVDYGIGYLVYFVVHYVQLIYYFVSLCVDSFLVLVLFFFFLVCFVHRLQLLGSRLACACLRLVSCGRDRLAAAPQCDRGDRAPRRMDLPPFFQGVSCRPVPAHARSGTVGNGSVASHLSRATQQAPRYALSGRRRPPARFPALRPDRPDPPFPPRARPSGGTLAGGLLRFPCGPTLVYPRREFVCLLPLPIPHSVSIALTHCYFISPGGLHEDGQLHRQEQPDPASVQTHPQAGECR
jgi:hypothetical protein